MRREDSFPELARTKRIIIPIIQRDYAQGRNNPKAVVVRTRLIDEWIDILQDQNLRMDFNYIYGNEDGKVFYPVDGQQRLTSLYLLHWYLAMATDNVKEIKEWQFDYKTRNSAAEFFSFLRDAEKSKKLFRILYAKTKETEKQAAIRNESWFKSKWENDPSVISCVNFLCMLSDKLSKYDEQLVSFWERLYDTDCPAVYFTCLNECDDEFAEIDAAKKYTRMNARGKRLSNFENLKAMIDEIEMQHISELAYCAGDAQEMVFHSISWAYDRDYIDCMFRKVQGNSLIEKTKAINDESEKWFRLVYYVYALIHDRKIPGDIMPSSGEPNENYEDVIYKISQERVKDDKITEYLYMMKAVFEVLCSDGNNLSFRYDKFDLSETNSKIDAISFTLLVSKLWNMGNCTKDNEILVHKWEHFHSALLDLNIYEWKVHDDRELALIVNRMVEGIVKSSTKTIDDYFVANDFTTNSPFDSIYVLDDIKCRLIERKIKSKLILDGADINTIDKVSFGNRRWGYLYYICGYLEDWNINDWGSKRKWDDTAINDYIHLIDTADLFRELRNCGMAEVVYAYSSQYDLSQNRLLSSSEINQCNNEHVWNPNFLEWNDDEFHNLSKDKSIMLDHFKKMLDLLLAYKVSNGISNESLVKEYVKVIKEFFVNHTGYEKCWLRFATMYPNGGRELFTSELENENGVVTVKNVPVILKTYLAEEGYRYTEKIAQIKNLDKKCNFFTADENRVLYSEIKMTCTFAPDEDDSGKYQHSKKTTWGWDLSGNTVNRNMDLFYRAYLSFAGIGVSLKNHFWAVDMNNGVYTIKVYEIGNPNGGRLSVNVREASMDADTILQIESRLLQWKNRFDAVEKEPGQTGNYDHWIELWNNDYQTAFGSSFVQGNVTYDKSGAQRARKVWSEVLLVPNLNWNISTINI